MKFLATNQWLEHTLSREATMKRLRYRVICERAGERIEFEDLDKTTAIQVAQVMRGAKFRSEWHGYLPAPESRVLS